MKARSLQTIIVTVVLAGLPLLLVIAEAQSPSGHAAALGALKTPWGEPNLEGLWTDEVQTPFQRNAKYAGREFLTDAEVAALTAERRKAKGRDFRPPKGTEGDVAGAYNAVFDLPALSSDSSIGRRTSMIVDPPDGRIPPLSADAQKRNPLRREYLLAILQATDACKNRDQLQRTYGNASCAGGTYAPTAPRREEPVPFYNVGFLNRADGPEDRSLGERCMAAQLLDFSGFRRIVQSPGAVSVFYDVGQGQGWHRDIPMTDRPHVPAQIRRWWGDSRGRWEGATLVVDVTNFSPKTDFRSARENLHVVERWTRIDATTLEYVVTIEDPTTWTKGWTVKQQLTAQSEEANRIYYEPRCHEGNLGMVGMLAGAREAEKAFR